ncbi:hypothetical protein [Chryseobacterium pennipullorum]|uniref:Uncharacterized protein n=1 Tax=Chryseobacterium pennipullorum TaxID=2258963 RepID=A0A3D9AZ05_9FLAO|nr:hypothetical protein [Chryseobacterium pennipullorum]REC46156.1 hypothetical protein DRF67_15495 [Chryseobacterium pennipullorum]
MENNTRAPLHIYIESKPGQVFHKDIGWLELKQAESFDVYIKEYKDEKDKLDQKHKSDRKKAYNDYSRKFDEVQKEDKKSDEFIKQNYEKAKAGQVKKETYDANLRKREEGMAARQKQYTELSNEYHKNLETIDKKHDEDVQAAKDKYKSVRWVHQLVGDRRPELTEESFNESVGIGTTAIGFTFDEFLEGGGAVYLEPFWEGTKPQGRYPHGILINAKGKKPEVILGEWTDAQNNKITNPLKFGSSVYLNIYTGALYGNNIQVQLKDKDQVIRIVTLGLTNADDKLFATEYLSNNTEERGKEDIAKQGALFERAVSVHREKRVPGSAKTGYLVEDDNNKYDGKAKGLPNVQKSKFVVYIDPLWETMGGESLEIYPVVYHDKIPGKQKTLQDCILKVHKNAKDEVKVDNSNSNKVVVLSQVETDIAFFHPCQYSLVTGEYNGKKATIFERIKDKYKNEIYYRIVADDKEKPITITIADLKTDHCAFENKPEETHEKKAVTIKNAPSSYKNLNIGKNNISFSVFYPKPTHAQALDMMSLSGVKKYSYPIALSSCAISKPLTVEVLPALYYEVGFKLAAENPFFTGQTKSYTQRKYLGKGGFFNKKNNKKIRKAQSNAREENYKNEKQEVKEGRLSYNQFEVALEWGFNDIKEEALTLSGEHPVLNIIDSAMWVINTISLLSFNKEADEAIAENKNKRPDQVKKRDKKRNAYLAKKNKTLSKIPFKIEIGQPAFAGAVKWSYVASEKEGGEVGTLYEVKFKADPLIEIKGSLDLLFVATKIPYVGQVVQGMTAVADTVGSADDFWNQVVDFFGGGDDYKIQLDIDYYLDLFVSGAFKIEATATKYHTVDGFKENDISPSVEIKFGIECGGSLKAKFGNVYSVEAEFLGSAYAVLNVAKNAETNSLECKYQGLYATVKANIKTDSDNLNSNTEDNDAEPDEKKFLLHDGFAYEFKLD